MASFKYVGQDMDGNEVKGVVDAADVDSAVHKARETCEAVLEITEIRGKQFKLALNKKPNAKALSLVCKQFSIILTAGLPLVQAVRLASSQCQDKTLKKLLAQAAVDINDGWSLSYSFDQRGKGVLPVTFLEAISAGEESGDLVGTFERMSGYFERMNKTRDSLVSALTYPALVIATAVVVVGIIMVYAVPAFTGMFEDLGGDLPWVTKILVAMSDFFTNWWLVMVVIAIVTGVIYKLYSSTEQGGLNIGKMQVCLPVIGSIVQCANSSQFARTMSTMLYAGMPLMNAVGAAGRTMSNKCMAKDVLEAVNGIEAGMTLGDCLSSSIVLPEMLVQMTIVGESSGALEKTLGVVAEYYDNETDSATKQALAIFEPIIIVILAVFVMFILMAVYLPMFSVYGDMNAVM